MSVWHRVAVVERKVEVLDATVSVHAKILSDHQLDSLIKTSADMLALIEKGHGGQ